MREKRSKNDVEVAVPEVQQPHGRLNLGQQVDDVGLLAGLLHRGVDVIEEPVHVVRAVHFGNHDGLWLHARPGL